MYLVGVSDAPVSSTSSNAKLTEGPTHRTTQAVPRSPSSNVSTAASTSKVSAANLESGFPKTPAKGMTSIAHGILLTVQINFDIQSRYLIVGQCNSHDIIFLSSNNLHCLYFLF